MSYSPSSDNDLSEEQMHQMKVAREVSYKEEVFDKLKTILMEQIIITDEIYCVIDLALGIDKTVLLRDVLIRLQEWVVNIKGDGNVHLGNI
jgi:hypothetical protein